MTDVDDEERNESEAPMEAEQPPPAEAAEAKDEFVEALAHFKSAASIMLERATRDPRLKDASREAGRVLSKLGSAAEPVARQFGDELSRLTQKMTSDDAEPVIRQVGDELSRFTQKMASAVESTIDAVEGLVDGHEDGDGDDESGDDPR